MTKWSEKKLTKVLSWAICFLLLYIMTALNFSMWFREGFLVIATSILLCWLWKEQREEKWELAVLILGLFARIIFCYIDVYTDVQLPIGGGNDGITFMKTAVEYCNGDFSRQYTRYPYVLYMIFQVTGIDQFAAQYVNIICWGMATLALQKSCKRLEIFGIFRLLAITIMAWLPTSIWITSILYRDTIVMLFLFLSFYLLLCWMQEKRTWHIVFSVGSIVIAALMHGGSIVMLLPIAVTVFFYSHEKREFVFTKRRILCGIGICAVGIFILMIPTVWDKILNKIPYLSDGLIGGLNSFLVMKYDYSEAAGSNYLTNRYVTGYLDVIIMTIQRVYYQMLSPAPDRWRGLTDVIAFWGSTAPIYLVSMILWVTSLISQRKDAYRFVMFMEIAITVVLYAWANVNAGAALRHREKIAGLVILIGIYSLKLILQNRKERKNGEKNRSNEL